MEVRWVFCLVATAGLACVGDEPAPEPTPVAEVEGPAEVFSELRAPPLGLLAIKLTDAVVPERPFAGSIVGVDIPLGGLVGGDVLVGIVPDMAPASGALEFELDGTAYSVPVEILPEVAVDDPDAWLDEHLAPHLEEGAARADAVVALLDGRSGHDHARADYAGLTEVRDAALAELDASTADQRADLARFLAANPGLVHPPLGPAELLPGEARGVVTLEACERRHAVITRDLAGSGEALLAAGVGGLLGEGSSVSAFGARIGNLGLRVGAALVQERAVGLRASLVEVVFNQTCIQVGDFERWSFGARWGDPVFFDAGLPTRLGIGSLLRSVRVGDEGVLARGFLGALDRYAPHWASMEALGRVTGPLPVAPEPRDGEGGFWQVPTEYLELHVDQIENTDVSVRLEDTDSGAFTLVAETLSGETEAFLIPITYRGPDHDRASVVPATVGTATWPPVLQRLTNSSWAPSPPSGASDELDAPCPEPGWSVDDAGNQTGVLTGYFEVAFEYRGAYREGDVPLYVRARPPQDDGVELEGEMEFLPLPFPQSGTDLCSWVEYDPAGGQVSMTAALRTWDCDRVDWVDESDHPEGWASATEYQRSLCVDAHGGVVSAVDEAFVLGVRAVAPEGEPRWSDFHPEGVIGPFTIPLPGR